MDDRYLIQNAREKIAGYYFPAAHEVALGKQEDAFNRAKAECLAALRAQIDYIERFEFGQFATKQAD